MDQKRRMTGSTESAFHALGLADADELVLRAELMRRIGVIIKQRGLTQPRVSALLRGRITKFSIDRLLMALSQLGQNVEVRITPSRVRKGRLRIAA